MTEDEMARIPEGECTSCGGKLDAASNFKEGETPRPNDISICINCGHFAAFSDDLSLRELTDKEVIEIAGMPELVKMNNARAEMVRRRNAKDALRQEA